MKKSLLAAMACSAAIAVLTGCAAREQRLPLIGKDRAGEIAAAAAGLDRGDAEGLGVTQGSRDGLEHYAVEFEYGGARYEYYIDALSGRVIEWSRVGRPDEAQEPEPELTPAPDPQPTPAPEPKPQGGISPEEAKELALSLVPGAAMEDIREFETDYDDGRLEYEGKVIYREMEYEFEIDGYSGSIRSWEAEAIHD